MATVELFEKWSIGGPWEYTAPVTVDPNGVLTVDANTNGTTSMYPCFGERHYVFADSKRITNSSSTKLYEFKLKFNSVGQVTFGFTAHPSLAAAHFSKYEISYDGTGVRFFARGASSFDHQTLVPGSEVKIRVAFTAGSHRFAVCAVDGTLVAEDITNTAHLLNPERTSSYSEPANTACSMIAGPYSASIYYGSNQVFISVRSGSVSFDPIRVVTDVSEGNAYAVENGTSASVRATPVAPTLGVTDYQNGMSRVVMTPADSNTVVVMTRNRGSFYSDEHSIIEDAQRLDSETGAVKAFTCVRPSVFRVVAHNGTTSPVTTQYVGPATDVAIPEISLTRWDVSSSSACVKIFCADSSASIRFTVDGSEPTTSSMLYTEPLFIKSTAFLRAKAFKGALSSVTVNATYIKSGLSIPNPYDTSLWVYNGNATFSASDIVINDPTGLGVAFREDAYEQTSYDTLYSGYAQGGSFKYVTSFDVSGPFRLKVPGTDAHIAWVGNAAGLVANTAATPATSMGGAVKATVTITGNKYVSASYDYYNQIVIVGKDSGETTVATVTLNYETQPLGVYANTLSFTSEGLSAYTVTNLSLKVLSSANASIDTGTPLIDTVSARNILGATPPAATTSDYLPIVAWDYDRNWPFEYKNTMGWRVEDMKGRENGYRLGNILTTDNKLLAVYGGTAADSDCAWFTGKMKFGVYTVPPLCMFNFGWSTVSTQTPAIRIAPALGVSAEMDTIGAVGGGGEINLVSAPAGLASVTGTILRGLKHDVQWRCGRKIVGGHIFVRTVILNDGGDASYNPIHNNIVYDTGWIDAGTAPAVQPRPCLFVRGPLLSKSGDDPDNAYGQQYVSIAGGLTEAQLDAYMAYGAPAASPTPTLSVGAQAANGTYPVTATSAGASSIVLCAGDRPLQLGGSTASNRWSSASGGVTSVPEVTDLRAIAVGSGSQGYSDIGSVYVGEPTASYIGITTRPGIALIRVLPRTKAYVPPTSTVETIWVLWLNGFRAYELDLSTPGEIELNLEPGDYSAVITRELRAGRNAGTVGTTPTPIVFNVPSTLEVSVVCPSRVVAGTAATFVASAATEGVSYKWDFSDGTSSTQSTAVVSFQKPGKYRWNLSATNVYGEITHHSGSIVATFTPGLTVPTNLIVGNQERVS